MSDETPEEGPHQDLSYSFVDSYFATSNRKDKRRKASSTIGGDSTRARSLLVVIGDIEMLASVGPYFSPEKWVAGAR